MKENIREISIQITLNGFSFCSSKDGVIISRGEFDHYDFHSVFGEDFAQYRVYVGWLQERVMLVPGELFDACLCREYLEASNLYNPSNQTLHDATMSHRGVALWQVETTLMEEIMAIFPEAIHYHPLQLEMDYEDSDAINLVKINDIVSITIFNTAGQLVVAQSVEFTSATTLLYVVRKLSSFDVYARLGIRIWADHFDGLDELFSRYYTNIELFEDPEYYHKKILECE